jgi:hypothetical protein
MTKPTFEHASKPELTMGYGSSKLDGCIYGSWVSGVDPLTHKYFYFYSSSHAFCANAVFAEC